jgi:hypothetical protein
MAPRPMPLATPTMLFVMAAMAPSAPFEKQISPEPKASRRSR